MSARVFAALTSSLLVAAAAPVFATDLVEALLEEVVVVAQPQAVSRLQTPSAVTTVTALDINERFYRTLPQALRDVPGVMVQETSAGQGSPYIRGFTGYRTVFVIDGVRLNNAVFREGPNQYWSTVDAFSVDQIEVLRGPQSVLYGSDAIGGTVYVSTPDIERSGVGAYLRGASAENSQVRHLRASQRLRNHGLAASVTSKSFGDLVTGTGDRVRGVGYDEWGANAKWQSQFGSWRLTAAHQRLRQNNVPRTHRTLHGQSFKGTTVGTDLKRELDQERRLSYLRVENRDGPGILDRISMTVAQHEQRERRDRLRSGERRDLQGLRSVVRSVAVEVAAQSAIGELTLGADYSSEAVDSFSSSNPVQGPVADDASYRTLDVYLHDYLTLGATRLTLGARHTRPQVLAQRVQHPLTGKPFAIEDQWSATVGSIGVSHSLSEQVAVFGSVNQGFRAPNLSDLTRFDSARSDEIEVPSPGLEPERFIGFEVGFKVEVPGRLSGQLSYYHTRIEDLIARFATARQIDGDTVVDKRNLGHGRVQGVELETHWQVSERWSLGCYAGWMAGAVDSSDTALGGSEPLSRMMPFTTGARARFAAAPTWYVEAELKHAARADRLSELDRADTSRIPPDGTPGYTVAHLRAGWRLSERLRLYAAVDNLFDVDYRIHGSGTNMPGRNAMIGIDLAL